MPGPQLPSLSALRAFEAAARHLSFTRAAQELFVTQAAISHQVRALEEEVGCPLFVRLPRRVALSESGRVLAEAATEAFGRISVGMEALSHAGTTGVVNVSVSPSMAVRWLVPRLESFRNEHPDIDVRFSANDRLIDPVREGVDLCIRYGTGRYPGLESTLLMKDEVFPVCSPALLQRQPLASVDDLKDHVLLHDDMMKHDVARPDWPKWFEAAGVDSLDPRGGLHFSHASMALDAALAGQGVALGRSTLVNDDVAAGRLIRPFETGYLSGFSYYLAAPKGGVFGARIKAFRDWLLRQAKEFTVDTPDSGPAEG